MGLGDPRFRKAILAQSLKQKNLMMGYSARRSDSDSEDSSDSSDSDSDEGIMMT